MPIAVMKRDNLKRHHHIHNRNNEFANECPPGTTIRKDKIRLLKIGLHGQQSSLKVHYKQSDLVTEASFKVRKM